MSNKEAVQRVEDLDIGALVVRTATGIVKQRPVGVSLWVLGLLLAAFAKGMSVDETTRQAYSMTLEHADQVNRDELGKALRNYHKAEVIYNNAKGWFWTCDDKCRIAQDKLVMAQTELNRVQVKRDRIVTDARREVGIWSEYGVQDVRNSFWDSWKSGKDMAARWTMMDAMFTMISGREETLLAMVAKLVVQYIMNLTIGLIGALVYFAYNVYTLIVSYGEPVVSGLAFFLLVCVAATATIGSYLVAIYGTVAGGGLYLAKQAAKQSRLEGGGHPGYRPRQVTGSGRVGGTKWD